jgi:hypothetical protein
LQKLDVVLSSDPLRQVALRRPGCACDPADPAALDRHHERRGEPGGIAGLKNDLSPPRPEYRKVKIRLFQPAEPLPLDPLDFDPSDLRKMVDAGYAQSAISVAA